ncbi:hypothetical protein [Candidatus Mycobacterium methanotrophicum]|uniref:Uncharacterized protein n=1 Tax=Candidatus Mycobacterium methanotrophicum TaxID=2943498 RepID=A0ABY4QJU6_9MYCO|nr:hypothetical protein [Candidatus Mycobacterium methanotrophicum]UQX10260.1 hypothetical protein M5I08_19160 [Candidatus Mycobacterium methanotrophicum]
MPSDPNDLDPEDPFELDEGNRPHLCGHPPYSEADLRDIIFDSDAKFYPTGEGEEIIDGRRRAQWLNGRPAAGRTAVARAARGPEQR